MPRVFLSHSAEDRAFVERLAADLSQLDIGVWLDKWEIRVGDSIVEKVSTALRENDFLAVVLSPSSVRSRWVRRELNVALMAQLSRQSIMVLPLLLRRCRIPEIIADIKYADFTGEYDSGLADLLRRLTPSVSTGVSTPPQTTRAEIAAPEMRSLLSDIQRRAITGRHLVEIELLSFQQGVFHESLEQALCTQTGPLSVRPDPAVLMKSLDSLSLFSSESRVAETQIDLDPDFAALLATVLQASRRHINAMAGLGDGWSIRSYVEEHLLYRKKRHLELTPHPILRLAKEPSDPFRFYDCRDLWAGCRALTAWAGTVAYEMAVEYYFGKFVPFSRFREALLHLASTDFGYAAERFDRTVRYAVLPRTPRIVAAHWLGRIPDTVHFDYVLRNESGDDMEWYAPR